MQYLMLIGAAILQAADFSFNKKYQKAKGTDICAGLGFNSLLGLFTAIIFFAINGFKVGFSPYSFAMAAIGNALLLCYNLIGFRLMKSGTMATYTLFLMSGGMTLPYIFGLLFLDEEFSLLRAAALVIILAGVILSNTSKEKTNPVQLIMCIAVFVLNGFVSITSKLHQIETGFTTVSTAEFVMLGGIFKFVFAGILYLIAKKHSTAATVTATEGSGILLLVIFASATSSGLSYLLQLFGAASLPATVLYPFMTGGTIVATSLSGVVIFKEKLSKYLVAGIILCFIGTLMFL